MKKLFFITLFAALLIWGVTTPLFQQEVPQNTIRILVSFPLTEQHHMIQPLIVEKHYMYHSLGDDFELLPPDPTLPKLFFKLVRDENTRALTFLKGEADILYNNLTLSKTEWLRKQPGTLILEAPGNSVNYLALNHERISPEIKKVIEASLPIKDWVNTIFFKWVEPPPEVLKKYDLEAAQKIKIAPITLEYLSAGYREGIQLGQLVKEALSKVGIRVVIHTYEPALYYAKIRKGEFDLFGSRTIPGSKSILDTPGTDLIPLFTWKHGLIVGLRIQKQSLAHIQLDETFRFLSEVRL